MIGKIITSDLTSRISYSITGIENGRLFVIKNTNRDNSQSFEGLAPEGQYVILDEVFGDMRVIRVNYCLHVDNDGLLTTKAIPDATT